MLVTKAGVTLASVVTLVLWLVYCTRYLHWEPVGNRIFMLQLLVAARAVLLFSVQTFDYCIDGVDHLCPESRASNM